MRVRRGKLSVGVGLGDLEGLLGPVGGTANLPLVLLILGDVSDQIGGDRFRVGSELVNKLVSQKW